MCSYKSTEREPWKGASLGEGIRGFADPQSPSSECEGYSSSPLPNLGKWRSRIWGTTPPTYLLSVYPCLEKETIISQFFLNVIEFFFFLRWVTKRGHDQTLHDHYTEKLLLPCVCGSESPDISCSKKSHQFIIMSQECWTKADAVSCVHSKAAQKIKKKCPPKHSESVLNWRSAISWDLPTGFQYILLIISKQIIPLKAK